VLNLLKTENYTKLGNNQQKTVLDDRSMASTVNVIIKETLQARGILK